MKKALLALLCLSVLAATPACKKKEEKRTMKHEKKTGKKKAPKTKKMDAKKMTSEVK